MTNLTLIAFPQMRFTNLSSIVISYQNNPTSTVYIYILRRQQASLNYTMQ